MAADELRRRPVARVVELGVGHRASGVEIRGEAGEAVEMLVAEDAELSGEALTNGLDVRRAGHGEPEAALGAHRQPAVLVVRQGAIGMALLVGERRQHEPIRHRRTVQEVDGFERRRHGGHAARVSFPWSWSAPLSWPSPRWLPLSCQSTMSW